MSTTPLQPAALPAAPPPTTSTVARRYALAYSLYTVATSLRFTQAVWVIYLAAHGYSPFAIGLFEMGFHLAKFVAEVPTGVFADLVGRRASLIVSCTLGALAEVLFLHPTAPLIALSLALSGVAYAFRGGADAALLWSLAERSGAPDVAARYTALFSRMFILVLVAEAIAVGSGGFLLGVGAALPFVCQGIAIALGILPLLSLPERRLARSARPRPLTHAAAGLRTARRDPVLLALLLLSGLLAGVFTTVSIFATLFFSRLGFSPAAVGLIFAVAVVPNTLYAVVAPRLIARVPRGRLLAGCIVAECLGLVAMCLQRPVLSVVGFLLLFYAVDSIVMPAISRFLNERAPEAQRATVLSLDTGLFSAVMIVLFPLFGLGLTRVSFGTAYLWTLLLLAGGSTGIAALAAFMRRPSAPLGAARVGDEDGPRPRVRGVPLRRGAVSRKGHGR